MRFADYYEFFIRHMSNSSLLLVMDRFACTIPNVDYDADWVIPSTVIFIIFFMHQLVNTVL